MKTRLTVLVLAVAFGATVALASGSGWLTSWKKAVEKAKKDEKPILVEFTKSDSDETCRKLTKEVFRNSKFRSWAKKNVVLMSVDFPEKKKLPERTAKQNAELAEKYEITEYPTVLLLSATGEVLGTYGYVEGGAGKWLEKVKPTVEAITTSAGKWLTDWEQAKKLSKATGRPILADFTGSDWCGWCKRLKAEVFEKDEFKKWAKKNVILLELDYPRNKTLPDDLKKQNESLKTKYQIRGYPTVLFIDANEKVLAKTGYVKGGPEAWIEDAEKKLK
ncbi:MAG: thioredoxin family protein [Planctomycetota bacterium]